MVACQFGFGAWIWRLISAFSWLGLIRQASWILGTNFRLISSPGSGDHLPSFIFLGIQFGCRYTATEQRSINLNKQPSFSWIAIGWCVRWYLDTWLPHMISLLFKIWCKGTKNLKLATFLEHKLYWYISCYDVLGNRLKDIYVYFECMLMCLTRAVTEVTPPTASGLSTGPWGTPTESRLCWCVIKRPSW